VEAIVDSYLWRAPNQEERSDVKERRVRGFQKRI